VRVCVCVSEKLGKLSSFTGSPQTKADYRGGKGGAQSRGESSKCDKVTVMGARWGYESRKTVESDGSTVKVTCCMNACLCDGIMFWPWRSVS